MELLLVIRERYGYMLNLFMFWGKFNESVGYSLADLPQPTLPPPSFVPPQVN
jgi:hypothetical protein